MPNIGFWAAAGAGGGGAAGAYELISSTILSSTATSVTFSSIDTTTYKHLQIRYVGRSNETAENNSVSYLYFNGDTAANYNVHYLIGSGTSVTSGSDGSTAFPRGGYLTGPTSAASSFGGNIIDILDAGSSSKYKTWRGLYGQVAGTNRIGLESGLWRNTAAVTSVTLLAANGFSYVSGSRFSLYGIKG